MILIFQIIAILSVITGLSLAYLYQTFPYVPWVGCGVALAGLVAYIWLDRQKWRQAMTQRSTLHGLNAGVKALLVLAIAVVCNLIIVKYDWKIDATRNKLNSLSDQSIKVVRELQHPIMIRAFVNPQSLNEYKEIFDRYAYVSNKNVKVEFMDVLRDPVAAKNYNVTQLDTILIESEARTARVENLANGPLDSKLEEKLTNAIIQASKGSKKKAYFLAGHGERSLSDARQGAYTDIKSIMQEGRFDVSELKLVTTDKIPDDAQIVIVAGAKSELMPHELKALEEFLVQRAGRVMMLVEPDSPASLEGWLAKFGVGWKPKKAVVELNALRRSANSNPVVPFIETYSRTHPITKEARMPTILQLATPLTKTEKTPEGYVVEELFSTSPLSFEVAFQGDRLQVNEKTDRKGPLQIAFAVTGKSTAAPAPAAAEGEKKDAPAAPEFRLVVVGDADFAANGVRTFGMNTDLFMNMLSWLSSEEDLIAIRPRATDEAKLELTQFRVQLVQWASMIVAPIAMIAAAIAVWLFRRRR